MDKKVLSFIVLTVFIISIVSGCGIVSKDQFKKEVTGMKTRVETLESRLEGVESKQSEAERATAVQAQALEDIQREKERHVRSNITTKPRSAKKAERTKEIQVCLRNANFYTGEIDGIKGRQTRKAIKEFQRANGLSADGIVGKKTWALLSKYAEGPVRESQGAEGGAVK